MKMTVEEIKKAILKKTTQAIERIFGQEPESLEIGFPPEIEFGDFTIPCFSLAKQFKKSPVEIAKLLAKEIERDPLFQRVEGVGPYLNFKVQNKFLFEAICTEVISQGEKFGNSDIGRGERVMVEYLSPNTNKPLHLGHVRNGVFGMAISNLLEAVGFKVIKANLINDRGVPICKSMLAWKKWANGATPETEGMKGDHFVGKWYVRYNQEAKKSPEIEKELDREVHELLRKWEAGDPETRHLWETMNQWVYQGFEETYQKLGFEFDVFYYESDTYKLGKDIVFEGLRKGVFKKDEKGAVIFELPEEFGRDKDGKPKKVTILREDGTSLYITQDLGTALLKVTEHNLDRSIYVAGSEHEYYFRCLFTILKALGYGWADKCYHLSYGMVYLPEGKMKSREGKVVDADDLIAEMEELALEEIKKREAEEEISEQEAKERAHKIGVGAIKFYLLRIRPTQDIHFDPEKSISFDGFTGPYCQYAFARTAGILRKAKTSYPKLEIQEIDFSVLGSNQEELQLARQLMKFPEEVEKAAKEFNPARIVNYVYETAQIFNQFYNKHSVLSANDPKLVKARLILVKAVSIVLKKGLNLLGIEVLERM